MNSLNLLSGRVSTPQSPGPSRSSSLGNIFSSTIAKESRRSSSSRDKIFNEKSVNVEVTSNEDTFKYLDEGLSQLEKPSRQKISISESRWLIIPKNVSSILTESIKYIFSTLSYPGVYILTCMYDENGYFAPFSQVGKLGMILCGSSKRASPVQALSLTYSSDEGSPLPNQSIPEKQSKTTKDEKTSYKAPPSILGISILSRFNEGNIAQTAEIKRRKYHKLPQNSSKINPARHSIKIKFQDNDVLHNMKHQNTYSTTTQNVNRNIIPASQFTPSSLKSPVSPTSSTRISKYRNTPAPPRPLLPLRQPSYTLKNGQNGKVMEKTLILDLDETLIHSMAKGGRMSTGHMVEVKLNTIVTAGGNSPLGLQHPILYWVNKRPHCDEFLRIMCKWYNLVIFTASVQEYADPVIDLLEQERKLFTGRYYRQHCTYRQGAFIKDLSSIESDLSKVMILDNSPLSYMFHQENAIPIEGWINDPTDNDLLHLMPLLESLQYVTDVRTFLALRGGENCELL